MIRYNNIIGIMSNEPNPITDLSTGTVYNTGIELFFTPPSTTTDVVVYYECYADGVLKNIIYGSGEYITGLTKNTNYNLTVVVVYQNDLKSIASNVVNANSGNIDYTTYSDTTEATAYLTASGLSNTDAINSSKLLIYHLIDKGIWSSIFALYPFKGSISTQQKWNAKNPSDTDAAYRIVFAGTGTYSDLGFQTNGVNAYGDTKFFPLTSASINNFAMTLVCGTNNVPSSTDAIEMGCSLISDNVTRITVRNSNSSPVNAGGASGNYAIGQFSDARGIYTANKKSSSRTIFVKNGNIIARHLIVNPASSFHNLSLYIGADHPNLPYGLSNQRIQIAMMHQALTDGQIIQLYEIIDESENLAGRKTW